MIPIADIEIGQRKRSAGDVRELAESIYTLGLLTPITVCYQVRSPSGLSNEKCPVLIAGLRRLEACKLLGHTEIEANIVELYDLDLELAEIDENLIREDLTVMARGEQLSRRKHIFNLRGGEQLPTLGGRGNVGFAKDVEDKIGLKKSAINKSIKINDGIPEKCRDQLRGTDMEDSYNDLRELSKHKDDPSIQKRAVEAVKSGEKPNLRAALKSEPKPATKSATDEALDALADCLTDHPDIDALKERLKFFKAKTPWVGKLLWRLK